MQRVVIGKDRLQVTIRHLAPPTDLDGSSMESAPGTETIEVPFRIERRSGSIRILTPGDAGSVTPIPDAALIKAVVRGHEWARRLLNGEVGSLADLAREAGVTARYVSRLVRYAFLAPEVTEAILLGVQPARLTVDSLKDGVPLGWTEQRSLFGLLEK